MRIAVTGGSGFIGAATIDNAHQRGHEAWTVDRQDGYDILGGQLAEGLADADAVIHLAGVLGTSELFESVEEALQVNIVGSWRVMEWCLRRDARYVGILMPDVFPSVYTATKISAQRLATALHEGRGLQVNHVRAYNAYGPGQKYGPGHPQKIMPTFAVHAWHRKPLPIWGDGEQGVDLIHVQDLGRMLVDVAERPGRNAVFDGGTGIEMSVNRVAQEVCELAGWKTPEFEYLPMRPGENPTTGIQARGENWATLGWRPPVRDWAETVEFYRDTPL